MVYREIGLIAISSEDRTKYKNTRFGQDVEFCNDKTAFPREIAGLWRFK
jgi:hypothetical protein